MSEKSLLAELQQAALGEYRHNTPAYAYVFKHNNETGIRLAAPAIVLEFSDGPLGQLYVGTLYYRALHPYFARNTAKYEVTYPTRGEGHQKEVVLAIDLILAGSTETYARFLARLPPRADNEAVPYTATPNRPWVPYDVIQTTARATSDSLSPLVEIDVRPIGKKFSFNIPSSIAEDTPIDAWGYLLVRNSRDLRNDKSYYVDFTTTRILIFANQGDKDAVAVFGSYDIDIDGQLPYLSFQVYGGKFSDI